MECFRDISIEFVLISIFSSLNNRLLNFYNSRTCLWFTQVPPPTNRTKVAVLYPINLIDTCDFYLFLFLTFEGGKALQKPTKEYIILYTLFLGLLQQKNWTLRNQIEKCTISTRSLRLKPKAKALTARIEIATFSWIAYYFFFFATKRREKEIPNHI